MMNLVASVLNKLLIAGITDEGQIYMNDKSPISVPIFNCTFISVLLVYPHACYAV